jgi:small GTP-binding protein
MEDFYRKRIIIGDKNLLLEISDTVGHEEYAALRDLYYCLGDGFMIAIVSMEDLEKAHEFVEKIRLENKNDPPIVIVRNKIDLESDVSTADLVQVATSLNCEYAETSAKTTENVTSTFEKLANMAKDVRYKDLFIALNKGESIKKLENKAKDMRKKPIVKETKLGTTVRNPKAKCCVC